MINWNHLFGPTEAVGRIAGEKIGEAFGISQFPGECVRTIYSTSLGGQHFIIGWFATVAEAKAACERYASLPHAERIIGEGLPKEGEPAFYEVVKADGSTAAMPSAEEVDLQLLQTILGISETEMKAMRLKRAMQGL